MPSGSYTVLQLVGLFVALYVTFVILGSFPSLLSRIRRYRQSGRLDSTYYPRATIAYDLVPKLEAFLNGKAPGKFYISGADGYPLITQKRRLLPKFLRYPWAGFVGDMIKSGSEVNYILTQTDARDEKRLRNFKAKFGKNQGDGTLNLCLVSAERADDEDKELLEYLQTSHVVLVEAENERVMWIEGYHPADSTVAYACEFVAPDRAKKDARYDTYKKALVKLVDKYCVPPMEARVLS